ncbi:hypothetical protein QTJ10_18165 [Xanthomonas hortorum pv. vitians]|uniref:hypothetical protein n=1 Tax=Xanthomonas hortorum TaxID=56454 RepID=UPI0025A08E2F|nr:hypothetical protein [Xanthomonas hortorum]WJM78996.1 hypothetical protein QTJ10_18165 [Xanthomonas hortorum pv. vitians]
MTTTNHYHGQIQRATERLAQRQARELLAQQRQAVKRGRGLAESGTRMCRGGESDRMSDRAEEPIPGRAAAPTEASD